MRFQVEPKLVPKALPNNPIPIYCTSATFPGTTVVPGVESDTAVVAHLFPTDQVSISNSVTMPLITTIMMIRNHSFRMNDTMPLNAFFISLWTNPFPD
jgi:hypothetical protein